MIVTESSVNLSKNIVIKISSNLIFYKNLNSGKEKFMSNFNED